MTLVKSSIVTRLRILDTHNNQALLRFSVTVLDEKNNNNHTQKYYNNIRRKGKKKSSKSDNTTSIT